MAAVILEPPKIKSDTVFTVSHLFTMIRSDQIRSVAQSCLTLSHPMDCSLPGSSVHGTFQARILEWVVIPLCQGIFQTQGWNWVSCIADGFFTV